MPRLFNHVADELEPDIDSGAWLVVLALMVDSFRTPTWVGSVSYALLAVLVVGFYDAALNNNAEREIGGVREPLSIIENAGRNFYRAIRG